jgi:hypothetical protein
MQPMTPQPLAPGAMLISVSSTLAVASDEPPTPSLSKPSISSATTRPAGHTVTLCRWVNVTRSQDPEAQWAEPWARPVLEQWVVERSVSPLSGDTPRHCVRQAPALGTPRRPSLVWSSAGAARISAPCSREACSFPSGRHGVP